MSWQVPNINTHEMYLSIRIARRDRSIKSWVSPAACPRFYDLIATSPFRLCHEKEKKNTGRFPASAPDCARFNPTERVATLERRRIFLGGLFVVVVCGFDIVFYMVSHLNERRRLLVRPLCAAKTMRSFQQ